MDLQECQEFCVRWLHAWSTKNLAELLSFYTDDSYYQDPAKPEGITGSENLRRYFEKLFSLTPPWKWEVVETYPTSKGFVFKWKATFFQDPQPLVEYGMDIVEFLNDKISRNEVYFDRSRVFPPLQSRQSPNVGREKNIYEGRLPPSSVQPMDSTLSTEDVFRAIGDSLFTKRPSIKSSSSSPPIPHSEKVALLLQYRQKLDRARALLQKNGLSDTKITSIQASIAKIEYKIRDLIASKK